MDPNSPGRFRYLTTVHVRERSERVSVRISPVSVRMKEKARQSSKIRELAETVEAAGFLTLDQQARVLGVPRSTAWTIRRASHKASGLSASIINRMLAAPKLPLLVRAKILEYVEEKAAGLYGGDRTQRRRFTDRLSIEKLPEILGIRIQIPETTGRLDQSRDI